MRKEEDKDVRGAFLIVYIEKINRKARKKLSKTKIKDFEKQRAIVAMLKVIDDAFFEIIMQDAGVCEEILRVILQDEKLQVLELVPQKSVKNLQGRAVRLDAHCILGNGEFCNIEVQKENACNHLRRCRYNASCITANITDPGDDFEDVPEVYIIYISRFDMFKQGKTIYHAGMCIKETGEFLEDGLHEIYVNTKIDDGSDIARLMKCFEQESVSDEKFPKLSARVSQFKTEEKEVQKVCSLITDYAKEYAKEHAEEYARDYVKEYAKEYAKEHAEEYAKEYAKEHAEEYAKEYAKEHAEEYAKEYAKEEAKESVITMIRDGVSDEKIALYLNFTIEEVKAIRAEIS